MQVIVCTVYVQETQRHTGPIFTKTEQAYHTDEKIDHAKYFHKHGRIGRRSYGNDGK